MNLRAGTGVAIVTPDLPVWLAGFGDRTEPAMRVHDQLECRALVLDDGDRTLCLIVLDLLGMSAGFASPIRTAVANVLGIEAQNVITSCTHTHQGPNAMEGGETLGWRTPDGYGELLVERCVQAARAALDTMQPVDAFAGTAPLPDSVSQNRRGLPYEPTFSVLDLRAPDGARVASIVNLAIHPVSFGSPMLAVSTDWVGPFRAALERIAGGRAIMLSGALGDVNPIEHHTDIQTHCAEVADEADALGETLAAAAAATLAQAKPAGGALRSAVRTLQVRPSPTLLTQLVGESLRTVELAEWEVGGVRIVSVPGEGFHALGRAIVDARPGVTLLAGLAPTWEGYLPMPYGDGYEESVSLGSSAVASIADALVAGCLDGGGSR